MRSGRKSVLVATLIPVVWIGYSVFLFALGPYSNLKAAVSGAELPEERFGFTGADLFAFLEPLSAETIDLYSRFQYFDIPNALLTGAAFVTLIWMLSRIVTERSWVRLLVAFPVTLAVFDLAENVVLINTIDRLPLRFFGLGELAGTLNFFKMIAGSFTLVVFAVLLVAAVVVWFRRRTSKNSQEIV
ncbi:MAG: hypothetical protein DWQ47_04175 [Acidobacteria bacterium]|nr:MAG: hypothetical protein DWQ32_07725 [Acidobacteriota bacterium]REK01591.1 MAG: hypothetical protein DWQ38_04160 [Acidobacteriota bacterium]REK14547.1 MAG: hypothetical protein DWQ43_13415 [Acidobacteriota bacterium]REK45262.1 MAG: hypothetical protein DWQ47_04175 [Acidobacteriota bacterium]